MRPSLGSKRREMGEDDIATVTSLFGGSFEAQLATVMDADGKELERLVVTDDDVPPEAPEGGKVKLRPLSLLLDNKAFGFRQITIERPERDAAGEVVHGTRGKQKGKPQADSSLRDIETVPLIELVEDYFAREVLPHAPDAWIDPDKTRIGYEIPFNRHFYVFEPPRDLAEIDADLMDVTRNIQRMLTELAA